MRRLVAVLALGLMACSSPPPVINITVVMPPAPAPAAVAPAPRSATQTIWGEDGGLSGDWPQWGWRVFANGAVEGTPSERIEDCYQQALVVQERPTSIGPAQCHWVFIEKADRVVSLRF